MFAMHAQTAAPIRTKLGTERTFGAGGGYRPVKLWVGLPKNA